MFLKILPLCLVITSFLFAEDDRTNAEVLKDTVSDVIEAFAATAGAVASCETGNVPLGAALGVAAALSVDRAIEDGRELWSRMNDSNRDSDCEHSCQDHGGNDDHDGSNT